jgi:hypothetical protein
MKAKIVSMILLSMLLLSALAIFTPPAAAVTPVVKVYPESIVKGPANCIGQTITVAVAVENIANFYGFDVKFRWNTTYFDYVSKVVTLPVDTYNTPQPPSPWAGALHPSFITVKDIVTNAEGKYQLAIACQAPAPVFDGSGTLFTMTFVIKYQQWDFEGDQTMLFDFFETKLSDNGGSAIAHDEAPATFLMHGKVFEYPPLPELAVKPNHDATTLGEHFNTDIYLQGAGGTALDGFWDVQGFDFYLNYDTTLLDALTSTIDPTGAFGGVGTGFYNGTFVIANQINDTGGYIRIAFLGLPNPGGGHTPPYGITKIATITFNVTYESVTYPPPTCLLKLENPPSKRVTPDPTWPWNTTDPYFMVKIAGYPHADRGYAPWDGKPWSPPLPCTRVAATYKAPFKPPGRWIDLYTEYPDPYGGQGPNEPSDAFGPQSEITFYAIVTYNLDPVQQKTVSFEIVSPTGEFIWIRQDLTDTDGIASVSVRIPWPCEDPETRIFGIWHVTATVDIAEQVVTDTLTFEMGYLINIVSVEPLVPDYVKGEHMGFKITYDCISEQPHNGMFFVVAYDDLGVAIGYNRVWVYDIVKGTGYEVIVDCMTLPKWAFVGMGTVYANVLNGWPDAGGVCYCPEHSATFGILRAP